MLDGKPTIDMLRDRCSVSNGRYEDALSVKVSSPLEAIMQDNKDRMLPAAFPEVHVGTSIISASHNQLNSSGYRIALLVVAQRRCYIANPGLLKLQAWRFLLHLPAPSLVDRWRVEASRNMPIVLGVMWCGHRAEARGKRACMLLEKQA